MNGEMTVTRLTSCLPRMSRAWCRRVILSMLSELKRYCQYHDVGCKWEGELGVAESHEAVRWQ